MCICINCQFYKQCWIKGGLSKIPKIYTKTSLKLDFYNTQELKHKLIGNQLLLKIFLNVFTKKQEYEFDVIECEGFCEQPGAWLQ